MALRMRAPLPDLGGVAHWINGTPDMEDLAGRPVLVHFWSTGCHVCHEVAGRLSEWRDRYAPQGLAVISVHQPRSPEELDVAAVAADADGAMGIRQPCAIDNEHIIVDRFDNQYVPAYYVFNRQHVLRHFQAGDKGYDRIEAAIERALEEREEETSTVAP